MALVVATMLLISVLTAVSGCAAEHPSSRSETNGTDGAGGAATEVFPVGEIPDYQLGGPYEPTDEVGIVVRDRKAPPDASRYSICYVNAFQTQPGEQGSWPESALLKIEGSPLADPDWPDEVLLDTSTEESRAAILEVVLPWVQQCAIDGFDAVEFDNLDSFTRSSGALDLEDNLAIAGALVVAAHEAGLAAGQKNAAEYARQLRTRVGFDFAVAEECAAFLECGAYREAYGDRVLDIEYDDALPRGFAEMCADPDAPESMILRDRDLRTPSDPGYLYESCPRER